MPMKRRILADVEGKPAALSPKIGLFRAVEAQNLRDISMRKCPSLSTKADT